MAGVRWEGDDCDGGWCHPRGERGRGCGHEEKKQRLDVLGSATADSLLGRTASTLHPVVVDPSNGVAREGGRVNSIKSAGSQLPEPRLELA